MQGTPQGQPPPGVTPGAMTGGGALSLALLLIHLHFPEAESLKEKRKELQSVKAQLHGRLGAAGGRYRFPGPLAARNLRNQALTGGTVPVTQDPPNRPRVKWFCGTASRSDGI